MEQHSRTKNLVAWSALASILAGVIHLVIIPEHWSHAPAHGLFFLLVGLLQIGWGVVVWRKPSLRLYYIGGIMAGWLIVLYLLTRWLPAPFGHGPEAIRAIDVTCKVCEALGMLTLAVLIFQSLVRNANSSFAWRAVMLIVLISVISGFVSYGAADAADPLFLSLAAQTEDHHHEGDLPLEGHQHENATPEEHSH
jgi:hypothetical protein